MVENRVNETVGELRKWFKSPTTQILVNVESKSKYPFIIFGSLGPSFDASGFVPSSATEPLSSELRINDGIYNVCGSVSRPAPSSASVAGGNHHLQLDPDATPHGYVVTAFQTFPGEDSERLERNWITWTGIMPSVSCSSPLSSSLFLNLIEPVNLFTLSDKVMPLLYPVAVMSPSVT